MRLTKIYTKVGDNGTTLLATGERVSKDAPRIEAYGTVDELNAVVGCLTAQIADQDKVDDIHTVLSRVQNELFDLGAELSLPRWQELGIKLNVLGDRETAVLEQEMDHWNLNLAPLENFILPGGSKANAYAHLARTVCRRAERRIITLSEAEPLRADVIKYVNRLSDWFFVLGRVLSQRTGAAETMWKQRK